MSTTYRLMITHVSTEVTLPDGFVVVKSQWNHNHQRFDIWYLAPVEAKP